MFAVNGFTHQEVTNETNQEDQRKDKKSHSKGHPQDSCPKIKQKKKGHQDFPQVYLSCATCH